jgi:uncharacterized protein YbjT (DUF2867 family)
VGDARDVGEVAAKVLASEGYEGETFDLTGPEALTTEEVLTILSQVFSHKYKYVDVPEEEARKAMEAMKMPLWLVDAFMELHALVRNGHAATIADGVPSILDREPRSVRDWAKSLAEKR